MRPLIALIIITFSAFGDISNPSIWNSHHIYRSCLRNVSTFQKMMLVHLSNMQSLFHGNVRNVSNSKPKLFHEKPRLALPHANTNRVLVFRYIPHTLRKKPSWHKTNWTSYVKDEDLPFRPNMWWRWGESNSRPKALSYRLLRAQFMFKLQIWADTNNRRPSYPGKISHSALQESGIRYPAIGPLFPQAGAK